MSKSPTYCHNDPCEVCGKQPLEKVDLKLKWAIFPSEGVLALQLKLNQVIDRLNHLTGDKQ